MRQPLLAAGRPYFSQGINFRNTSGYVTDPAGSTYEVGSTNNYPHTLGVLQGGWETAPTISAGTRNRSTSVDARLAGVAFRANGGTAAVFRLDLFPGVYRVTLAMGDATNSQTQSKIEIADGSTSRLTLSDTGAALTAGKFMDAAGTVHASASAWVSSQQPAFITIASGILRVNWLANPNASASSVLAHIAVASA